MALEELERLRLPLKAPSPELAKQEEKKRLRLQAAELEQQQKLWRWLIVAALVVLPAIMLSKMPGFHLRWIWYLSLGAVVVQLTVSLLLLRREFRRRLNFGAPIAAAPTSVPAPAV